MAHLYVFDQNEQLLMILSEEEFESDEHKRQLNGSWTFTFTTAAKYASVLLKSHKIAFYDREGIFRLFVISEVPTLTYHDDQIDVYAVNDYFQLAHQIVEDRRLRDGTAREALSKVLEGSEYLIGEVADLGSQTISFYDVTRMEGLESIIEAYGGEIDFRIELDEEKRCISKKYIDLKARLGADTGLRFTFDSNLEEIKRSDTSEGHFTVLYGRGKGVESGDGYSRKIKFTEVEWKPPIHPVNKPLGQSFIEDEEAIAKYGRIEGIYENSNIEDPGELLQATYEALQQVKTPSLSYEVKAKDLAQQAGYEHFKLTLGDSVILLDEAYQISLESRIVCISESIREANTEQYLTLGSVQSSLTDSMGNAQITSPSESTNEDIEIDDSNFPNELPAVPQLRLEALFSAIMVEWTYENKSFYEYELYGSPIENFNPDSSNLIFRGKASTFLHQVKPKETWYYCARAINTHGRATDFSLQVYASTLKIEDGTDYFEKAAIADALIGELRLDRGWVGELKGKHIDAKELSVTNGNGVRTVYIDSFGNASFTDIVMQLNHINGNKYFILNHDGIVMYNPSNGVHQWGKIGALNSKFTVASNGNSSGLSLGHHVNEVYVEDIYCSSAGVVHVQRQMNHNGILYNNYGHIIVRQSGQGGWEITGRSDSQEIKPGGANQGAIGSSGQYINQSWIANRYNPSSLEFKHVSHYIDESECIKLVSEVQPARYFYKEFAEDGNDITSFVSRNSQIGLIYEDVRECTGRDLITNEEDKAINDYNMSAVLWGAVRNLNKRLNELEIENLELRTRLDNLNIYEVWYERN